MAALEILLLAFFLIFLVIILVRMDRANRARAFNEWVKPENKDDDQSVPPASSSRKRV